MTETDWIDATAFGSPCETQCRIVGTRTEWRHRPSRLMYVSEYANSRASKHMMVGVGAWRVGLPTDVVAARKKR